MASIKISKLPDLEMERLDDGDMFIVNDQNSTTTKLTFESLRKGLDQQEHKFMGSVEFHGQVAVLGDAAGTNIYTRTQTDDAIADAVTPVATDLTALTSRERDLETLVGATEAGGTVLTYYPIATFTNNSLKLATYTVDTALERLGTVLDSEAAKILANTAAINTNSTTIGIHTDEIAVLDGRVDALDAAVFGTTGGNLISDNADNIATNVDNIGALANTIGVAVGQQLISVGTITGGIIEANNVDYSVVAALGALETDLVNVKAKADANETAIGVSSTNISNVRDHSMATRNAVSTVCTQFAADVAGNPALDTASELASRLLAAVNAIVDPIYTAP